MHTFKQITENQENYKNEILSYLLRETKEAKKELLNIDCADEFILKEKEKLIKKFKKTNTLESIKKYFYSSSKRDENYYVWWDVQQEQALILAYGKK